MARKTSDQNSVQNNTDINGDNNESNQAGRDLIKGDQYKTNFPDEGRVKTDAFTAVLDVLRLIGGFLFKTGVGNVLERLFRPTAALVIALFLLFLGNVGHDRLELTGVAGILAEASVYVSNQVGGFLVARQEIAVALIVLIMIPVVYGMIKLITTCEKCQQPFGVVPRTIEYPSRASFDQEGNRHVPSEQDWFCIYCDGDADIQDSDPIVADGGDNK